MPSDGGKKKNERKQKRSGVRITHQTPAYTLFTVSTTQYWSTVTDSSYLSFLGAAQVTEF